MKRLMIFAALTAAALCAEGKFDLKPVSPRKIVIGEKPAITLCKGGKAEYEVVKPANPAAAPAAKELIEQLAQITGKKVKPVAKASGKVPAFYLGVCPEAKALGLNPEKLDRDGYYIRTDGNRIFITGCDSNKPGYDMEQFGTLYGVYDFLERFAGVRYYFPGELGTIVPKKKDWTLPEIDITERPDKQYRLAYCYQKLPGGLKLIEYGYPGASFKGVGDCPKTWRKSSVQSVRAVHGLRELELVKRFAKTHPEYFAMTKDGRRQDGSWNQINYHKYGHLCYSDPGLKEVVYQDSAAALTGKPASSRGISRWTSRWTTWHVNPTPNDGIEWCQCPACRKIARQGKQAMSDHVWRFMIDIARRLEKAGIPGYVMVDSYGLYALTHGMDLPDNMTVQVAMAGPWAERNEGMRSRDDARLKFWNKKQKSLRYNNNKVFMTKVCAPVDLIPNFTPRAVGTFFKRQAPYIYGCMFEGGSDRWMFDALNCYVFSKVMWNTETDVEALLEEHCRLMYGAAAPMMNDFYRELENLWLDKIVAVHIETPWGVTWQMPTKNEIWTKIYSPEKIAGISALLDRAEKAVANDPQSLKRVKFMREQLWSPVVLGSQRFFKEISDRSAWTLRAGEADKITLDGKLAEAAWKKAEAVWLTARQPNEKVEVQTRVKMLQDTDNFYFGFEAEEPHTDAMTAPVTRPADSAEVWRDNGAEIFLSAELSSDFIYQFLFNSSGFKADLRNVVDQIDVRFNSGFEVKTNVIPGKMWTAEVRIPRKSMPELTGRRKIVGNFTRRRVLTGQQVRTVKYCWHLFPRNIAENCGYIQLDKSEGKKNLISFGDFDGPVHSKRFMGSSAGWGNSNHLIPDREFFVTGGVSLRLEGASNRVRQTLPVKPDKQYKLSFFVRAEKLTPGLRIMIRYGGNPTPSIYVLGDYRDYIRGTVNWFRVEKIFHTPKEFGKHYPPHIEFFIGKSTGKCWIDHVELVEVK